MSAPHTMFTKSDVTEYFGIPAELVEARWNGLVKTVKNESGEEIPADKCHINRLYSFLNSPDIKAHWERKQEESRKEGFNFISRTSIINRHGVSERLINRHLPPAHYFQNPSGGSIMQCWSEEEFNAFMNDPAVQKAEPSAKSTNEAREAALREKKARRKKASKESHRLKKERLKAEKLERERRELERKEMITGLLLGYTPEYYIQKARQLKRCFVIHTGPTNSGKTYTAIESLKANGNGTYLGPLRLLALEMYEKVNMAGIKCSLLTGEESIPVDGAKIVASTIELCVFNAKYKVAVIDEAQMMGDTERGFSWFKALCMVNADEVHVCVAPEGRQLVEDLVSAFGDPYTVVAHERLVPLVYTGKMRKFEDAMPGDAFITFSRKRVLEIAAYLEAHEIKASVIYGALPPEARRNEVRRYLDGKTKVVVATDAIGMGISLPIKRIVFTEGQKFDGIERRDLKVGEIKQIAGRAGRFGMFDCGEVVSMAAHDLIRDSLDAEAEQIMKPVIAFPREVLDSDIPFEDLLNSWQNLQTTDAYSREDLTIALKLYKKIPLEKRVRADRQLLLDLITCPVDSDSPLILSYWLDCANSILDNRELPVPYFGSSNLERCELSYRAYDVYSQMMRRCGKEAHVEKEKRALCDKIRRLMERSKDQYLKKCRVCGAELPIESRFGICDKCFAAGRRY